MCKLLSKHLILKAVYLFDLIIFTVCQSVRSMILPNYVSV